MNKPDCYKCKYRGSVPGDAHSCCKHPAFKNEMENPFMNVMAIFAGVGRVAPIQLESAGGIMVKGNAHGISSGWFNHPWNFDPIWLEQCNGFESKKEEVKVNDKKSNDGKR